MEGNRSTVRGALLPFRGADACVLFGNCVSLTSPNGLPMQVYVNEIVVDEIKGFLFF